MFLLLEVDVYQIINLSMYNIYLQVVSIKLYTDIKTLEQRNHMLVIMVYGWSFPVPKHHIVT